MKFGLFNQVPCTDHQSVTQRYQETLTQIQLAEELGFDTAWLAELHFHPRFSVMPSPLLFATALSQRTSRKAGHGGDPSSPAQPHPGRLRSRYP